MRGSSMDGSSHSNLTVPTDIFGEPLNWGGLLGHPARKEKYLTCTYNKAIVFACTYKFQQTEYANLDLFLA